MVTIKSKKEIEKILKNKGNTVKYEMPFKAFNAGKTDIKKTRKKAG